ncbi:tyrosine-type recombinase/integrase [Mailhella sp.]|uniref:tyrosine-type recombinase/integrase n=1 Tax=Mailhella sp. TaxID=1981029 RepID=UPI004064800E
MSIIAYLKGGKRAYRAKFKLNGEQITKAGFVTQREAKAWISEERKRLNALAKVKKEVTADVLMYSAASEQYLNDCALRNQPGTVAEKFRHLSAFVEWIGNDFPMENISLDTVRRYAETVVLNTKPPTDPHKSVNRRLGDLRALWNWCVKNKLLTDNPFSQFDRFSEDTSDRYIPPMEDIAAILNEANQWERDFITMLCTTGARPGEIRTLKVTDVDLSRGTVCLWTRKRKGGARQSRIISASPEALKMLQRRIASLGNSEVVFPNPATGGPLTRQARCYKFMMERLCRKAKVKTFTFYALRHFVAMYLRDSGAANRYQIQSILGHTKSDTTDIYLRSLAPDLREAVATLDGIFHVA